MKLFHKILIAPLLALVLLALCGATSMGALRSLKDGMDRLAGTRMAHVALAAESSREVLEVHSSVYRLLTWIGNVDEAGVNRAAEGFSSRLQAVEERLKRWTGEQGLEAREKALGASMAALVAKYRVAVVQSADLATADANAGMMAMQSADKIFQELDRAASELFALERTLAEAERERADASYGRNLAISGGVLALAAVATLALALFMARAIARPLREAIHVADRIAAGELRNAISAKGNDETAALSRALAAMQERLHEIVGRISQASAAVTASAHGLVSTSDEIAGRTRQESEAVSSTAAAIEQMTVSIAHVSSSADEARASAEQAETVSQQGVALIARASGEIQRVAGAVTETARSIEELQARSEQISSITAVIHDIADQTNLLALNAAIESARAGEQGRGFAVVADEVRKLAEKTGKATNEIKSMIESMRAETTAAVSSMQMLSTRVLDGAGLIGELTQPLTRLHEGAVQARASLTDLSSATREQTQASTQVAGNVERIARMSEENSAAAGQGTAAARHLEELAREMNETVDYFRC